MHLTALLPWWLKWLRPWCSCWLRWHNFTTLMTGDFDESNDLKTVDSDDYYDSNNFHESGYPDGSVVWWLMNLKLESDCSGCSDYYDDSADSNDFDDGLFCQVWYLMNPSNLVALMIMMTLLTLMTDDSNDWWLTILPILTTLMTDDYDIWWLWFLDNFDLYGSNESDDWWEMTVWI